MRVHHTVTHRLFGLISTAFCIAFLWQTPVFAQNFDQEYSNDDASVYLIEGVEVDVTAENAVAAREQAFAQAQIKAYKELSERLLTPEELEGYELPDADTISNLVEDFEVTNEQLSAVRYKGTYTFRFLPDVIQSRMAKAEIPYAAAGQKPILILPYQLYGNRSVLWDQDNPFMAAWARVKPSGLIATILPLGDIQDTQNAKDSQPLNYDKPSLDLMAARYNAEETIILLGERKPGIGLAVSVYHTKSTIPGFMGNIQVQETPDTNEMGLYDKAVAEVLALLRQDYKVQTTVDPGEISALKARARFNTVQEWVTLKRTIENAPGVQSIQVQGLKPREAIIEIEFLGGLNQLSAGLSTNGINMQNPGAGTYNQYNPQLSNAPVYELMLSGGRY